MITYLLKRLNNKPTIIQLTNRYGGVYTMVLETRFEERLTKKITYKEWNKRWIKK